MPAVAISKKQYTSACTVVLRCSIWFMERRNYRRAVMRHNATLLATLLRGASYDGNIEVQQENVYTRMVPAVSAQLV